MYALMHVCILVKYCPLDTNIVVMCVCMHVLCVHYQNTLLYTQTFAVVILVGYPRGGILSCFLVPRTQL